MANCIKNILEELKNFAVKGNVMDMAVGIIIGAAFGKIVDSMVKDVIMPPIGWLMGKVDFSNLYWTLPNENGEFVSYPSLEAAQSAGAVTVNYGVFINTLISFVIVVLAVFILVKAVNKLKSLAEKETAAETEATTKTCPKCFSTVNIKATKCPFCTSEIE